jgi:hypothetical protein
MNFAEFLTSIEGTEDEQKFLASGDAFMNDLRTAVAEAPMLANVRIIKALLALDDADSLQAIREGEHFEYLSKWDIQVIDMDKGMYSMYPGAEMRMKMAKVALAVLAGVVFLVWLCKRKKRK